MPSFACDNRMIRSGQTSRIVAFQWLVLSGECHGFTVMFVEINGNYGVLFQLWLSVMIMTQCFLTEKNPRKPHTLCFILNCFFTTHTLVTDFSRPVLWGVLSSFVLFFLHKSPVNLLMRKGKD